MHASHRQQLACFWKAASRGVCVRYHSNCAIWSRLQSGFRLQLVTIMLWVYPRRASLVRVARLAGRLWSEG